MKRFILLSLALLIASAAAVWAQQTTATLNGTVFDSQGAAIANAKVTVTNPSTSFTQSTVTNTTGSYSVPFLTPGTYNMRVEASGFSTLEQKNINLLLGQNLTINQTLKPGGASEVLEVTSEAPLIETSSSQIVGSVSPTETASLPIRDRNFAGLETLIPGVRQAEGFDPTKSRVGNISVNGGDGRQVDTSVDGGDNKDLVVGGIVQNFTMEGIQEFNVQTDRYTAEAGHSVAAVVNVISKSGTNTFHGSAFGLFQLSTLNANDYFTLKGCEANGISDSNCPKPLYHRYQFGGSFGGPIIKNKFFAFGAFEQKREPGTLTVNPATSVDLPIFATGTQGFPGAPYTFPVSTLPSPYIDTEATIKLDYKINERQSLSLRYARQKWTAPNDQLGSVFLTDGTQSNTDINNFHDLTLEHNFTVSANKVNSINLHFQDMVNIIGNSPLQTFTYPVLGGGTVTNPNINFSDGSNVGINVNVPQQTLIRKYQFRDDFSWAHGNHNFKFGGSEIYFAKTGGYFYSGLGYTISFWDTPTCIAAGSCPQPSGPPTLYPQGFQTKGAVKDILLNGGSGSTAQDPWSSLGLYFQDDWKIKPRLTLNLGLRWDANINFLTSQLGSSLTDSNKGIYDLRQVMLNPNFPTSDPGAQRIAEIVGNTGNLTRNTADWKEFQPRVGFAWDITGRGNHLLRGGYGIARDQVFQNITLWSIQQSQPTIYQAVFEATGSSGPGLPGCANVGTGPVIANPCNFQFGITPLPVPPPPTVDLAFGATPRLTNPQITDPWSQQMSIGYAWQINPDYALSVDYRHILGTHEERVLNMNPVIGPVCDPTFGGNPLDPRCVAGTGTRLMDYTFSLTGVPCVGDPVNCPGGVGGPGRFNKIYDYSTNNRSMYDSITFQLRKRMSKRMMFQASDVISWSRSWGGFPVASYGGSGLAITPEQQFAPDEFNRTNFNEPNRFVFSGVFTMPYGIGLSPIFQAASARPYSFLLGDDIDGDGRSVLDRVCVGSTLANPITTPGCEMLKPNTLTGKAYIELDLRVDKTFKFGDRMALAINWEFYNLLNRSNFCNSYEESLSAGLPSAGGTFNTPQSYCNGPSNAAFGGVSGYAAAATKSFSNQFGFRFTF